jgi:hypothetical protein
MKVVWDSGWDLVSGPTVCWVHSPISCKFGNTMWHGTD